MIQSRSRSALITRCAYCHRIRLSDDTWLMPDEEDVELEWDRYTHGICPACYEAHVLPQLATLAEQVLVA